MKQLQGIVFDLDGTLIDSVQDLAQSVNYTLTEMGLSSRSLAEIRSFVGDGVQRLIVRSLGDDGTKSAAEALAIFMGHYADHLTDHTTLYDGVLETLIALHAKYPLAVLTNKSEGFALQILKNLQVDHFFSMVIGGDTLPTRKPDPAGIFHVAAQWVVAPGQLLLVGDHVTDIRTGMNSGCPTVFLENGIGETGGLIPDYTLQSIGDLPGLMREMFA